MHEARGQVVKSPEDYMNLVQGEWFNLHKSLEKTNKWGNEKIQPIKLKVKEDMMNKIAGSSIDEFYLLLH